MNKNSKIPNPTQDDRLSNFADQALSGRVSQIEAELDDELVGLEQTVLRLQNAFPPITLDQIPVKQMQVRLNARIRRENQEKKEPFWKKWFEPQARLQIGMAFAAVALMVTLAVFSPSLTTAGSSTTGTALTPIKNSFVVIMLAGLILITIWIKRRK
jgi:hypothetical protein